MYKQNLDKGAKANNFREYIQGGGPFGQKAYFKVEPTTHLQDARAKIENTTASQDLKMGVKNAIGDPADKKLF